MMPEKAPPAGRDRPFPWYCTNCHEMEVFPLVTDYTAEVKRDGRPHTIRIPNLLIPTCRKCNERAFTPGVDVRIIAALRAHVGLLTPEEIHERRRQLAWSQQDLAEQLGVAKETIDRWETGAIIQSRALDNQLRLVFESRCSGVAT